MTPKITAAERAAVRNMIVQLPKPKSKAQRQLSRIVKAITAAERAEWLAREDTEICKSLSGDWHASSNVHVGPGILLGRYGQTKTAAINAAIRAERRAK